MSVPAPADSYPFKRLGEVAEFLTATARSRAQAAHAPQPAENFGDNARAADAEGRFLEEALLLVSATWSGQQHGDEAPIRRVRGNTWVCKGMHVLRPNAEVDLDYLYHVIRAQARIDVAKGKRQRVGKAMIAALGVPLPDLATQRSLAALLDRVQSLREQRTAAEPRLGSLLRMLYLERCGDPVTNPRRWPSLPFGRLGENQDALRSDPGSFSESRRHDATFPCYGASGVIQWSNHAPFDGPRLLVAESGTNLVDRSRPVARVVAGRFAVDRQAHVIGANGLAELRFLELSLELMELKPYLSGRSRARLTRASLERISVPLPPLALQRELCAVAERVESLRVLQGDSAARIDELSASLTRKLLRGELRI